MPLLQKIWKLKASLRFTSGYKRESFEGGVKPLFGKGPSNTRNSKPSVTGSAPGSHSHSRHPVVSSFFAKLCSSNWMPGVDHKPSPVDSSKHQALSAAEALFRVFATPSIHGPLLQSSAYSALESAKEASGNSLWDLSETGVYFLAGQLPGGAPLRKEERKVPKQVTTSISSRPQDACKEKGLCDRSIITDPDGVVDAEALKHESEKVTLIDNRAVVIMGINGLCDGKENFESNEGEDGVRESGSIAHLHRMLLVKGRIQGSLGIQKVFNPSIAHHLLHPGMSVPVVENMYAELMCNVRFTRAEVQGLVIDGNQEVDYADGRSRYLENKRVQHRNLRLLSGACCLPHPKKVKTGGEDAYFICSEEQVVGVADGVGGWADMGVDAGDYARELMLQSRIAVAQEPHGYIDPARIMLHAHAKTKCRGSSTACILALSDYGLQAANLGDSGFVLMRNGRTIFKSPVQQHQFNIPFQLESGGSDPPSAAEVFSLQVTSGDVVVAGTDGLFDNLYDNELMGVVVHSIRAGLQPQVTAQKIVALARERAEDRNRQTPFSTAAQEAGFRFYGGKMDDITVIVSYIISAKSSSINPSSKL